MWKLFRRNKISPWLRDYQAGQRNFEKADLRGQSFAGMSIDNVSFKSANLDGADFTNARLLLCDFCLADCSGAKFDGAKIEKSFFIGAKFPNCSLTNMTAFKCTFELAFVGNCQFTNCNLADVSFRDAKMVQCNFSDTSLAMCHFDRIQSATKKFMHETRDFLENMVGEHLSSFEASLQNRFNDTTIKRTLEMYGQRNHYLKAWGGQGAELYASADSIAEFFGTTALPKSAVADLVAQFERLANPHKVFISYTAADEEVAEGLNQRLSKRGFEVWYAPRKMRAGEDILAQLQNAINDIDVVLLVLSQESIVSNWVAREVMAALVQENKTGRKIVIPVRLAPYEALREWRLVNDRGENLAEQVTSRFMVDFSKWRDTWRFDSAVDELAKDLQKLTTGSTAEVKESPFPDIDPGALLGKELAYQQSMAEAKNPLLDVFAQSYMNQFFGGWCKVTPLEGEDLLLTCKLCGYQDQKWPGLTAASGCGDCGLESDTRGAPLWFDFVEKADIFYTGGTRPDKPVIVKCRDCAEVVTWSFRDGPFLKCPKCKGTGKAA